MKERNLTKCQCNLCGSAYEVSYDYDADLYICRNCLELELEAEEEEEDRRKRIIWR